MCYTTFPQFNFSIIINLLLSQTIQIQIDTPRFINHRILRNRHAPITLNNDECVSCLENKNSKRSSQKKTSPPLPCTHLMLTAHEISMQ